MGNEIKCYAYDEDNGGLQSLKEFLDGHYNDPDSVRMIDGKPKVQNTEYYKDICGFLSFREENFIKEKNFIKSEPYTYVSDGGLIEVKKENEHQFYLKTDQFGFCIPFQNKGIYDSYLGNTDNKDRIEFVKDCIAMTRSIGGSFLWALEEDGDRINLNPTVNYQRGDLRKQQDRVDLTLWLIKNNYKGGRIKSLGKPKISEWLKHFGSFETYVDFFGFNGFVNDNYIPWSIVNSDFENNKKEEIKDPSEERKAFLGLKSPDDIKQVLNNVCLLIHERSEKIEDYVNKQKTKDSKIAITTRLHL